MAMLELTRSELRALQESAHQEVKLSQALIQNWTEARVYEAVVAAEDRHRFWSLLHAKLSDALATDEYPVR